MKKLSTAATKQRRNFSQQKLTIGLDLGDRSSWYCVLDEAGEIVLEQNVGTTPKAMRAGERLQSPVPFLKSKNEIPATKVNMATF
jgi:hypothetical protein